MDSIESIKLNNVEVQANGIIRNEKGYLIGRLVGSVDYEGEHVKGLNKLEDPTEEDLKKPLFEAIWQAIKKWDIEKEYGQWRAGATGTDVKIIMNAFKPFLMEREKTTEMEKKWAVHDAQSKLQ